MVMKVSFEAVTAKELFRQIADFIEVGATPGKQDASASPARQVANEVVAPVAEDMSNKMPTPAVRVILENAGVPEDEWSKVKRTGKNGRMTQADAKLYVTKRESTETADEILDSVGAPPVMESFSEAEAIKREPVEEPSPRTSGEVKAAMQKLYTSGADGRGKCMDLLKRFGVERISQLDESQYGQVVNLVNRTLAGEYDPSEASDG